MMPSQEQVPVNNRFARRLVLRMLRKKYTKKGYNKNVKLSVKRKR